MTLSDTIISALVLAAIGSLTTVAYTQPSRYQKLSMALNILIVMGIIGFAIWNISNDFAKSLVTDGCGVKSTEIRAAIGAYTVPGWAWWGVITASCYINILATLPLWLL